MMLPRILFVLPAAGASGGANSVVQEATGLARLGAGVGIVVNQKNQGSFASNYPELKDLNVEMHSFRSPAELADVMEHFDVVVATVNTSIFDIAEARALLAKDSKKEPRVAYYVQDYEPLFYAPESEAWHRAYASYNHIPGAVLFAKTKWLQDMVYANHAIRVAKVSASIDHGIYFPRLDKTRFGLNVVAMLRPRTPRRAPNRTVRIMEMLADRLHDSEIQLTVFGTDPVDLAAMGMELSPRITNRGRLRRQDVPTLLRDADLFLDLSDYQAFGRTGLESMACGAISVVPVLGGTSEYAEHGRNAYVVDTRSDDEIIAAVLSFVGQSPEARARMRHLALEKAADFSVHKAALSELKLFSEMVGA